VSIYIINKKIKIMKNHLSEISSQEKNRILEMHKKSTQRHYLVEDETTVPTCPLRARVITPQGLGTELDIVKNPEGDGIGFTVRGLNICEFFQVKSQGIGQSVYKTKVQLTNIGKKGLYIVEADVRSIDLDLYPQVTNKLLGPGQQISFNIEITPASLKGNQVAFDVSYKPIGPNETQSHLFFPIENNIDKCAVD
jgi:hypothetical protein